MANVALIPLLPLASAVLLLPSAGTMPRHIAAILGAGSVGLAAICVALLVRTFLADGHIVQVTLWTWMAVGEFTPRIAFYIDGLAIVMMSVITGVGFLIHLYSIEFMWEDESICRYFAYMNLFVAAMLLLVMADNLLLLYLGWEGVGVCSYLLVGFWYRDPNNGKAARKAFVVTRVGDTAMAIGLFLLFTELGTLDIQPLMAAANSQWQVGGTLPILATALLLGGAVGKSAQLPLHTWLPDAMAGPTPVSALIHAATMVTAGVYLIARTYDLFLLAPPTQAAVAWIGLATLLLAAFAAVAQNDIKRILAYSTISQIGYMFLALGVSAFASGIFWSFLIGSAALAALPFSSGFYSKDAILLSAWDQPDIGHWLWAGGLLGALLTGIYSFRLVFVVFFGEAHTEPDRQPGWKMAVPLVLLCILALSGGMLVLPLTDVFPAMAPHGASHIIEYISIGTPLLGLLLAYLMFLGHQLPADKLVSSPGGRALRDYFQTGWRMDQLYDTLLVRPFTALAQWWRNEPVDSVYNSVIKLCQWAHHKLTATQTGELRWYATSMVFGLVLLLAIMLRNAT